MVLESELSIRRLDLALICRPFQPEDLVGVDGRRLARKKVVRVVHVGWRLTKR